MWFCIETLNFYSFCRNCLQKVYTFYSINMTTILFALAVWPLSTLQAAQSYLHCVHSTAWGKVYSWHVVVQNLALDFPRCCLMYRWVWARVYKNPRVCNSAYQVSDVEISHHVSFGSVVPVWSNARFAVVSLPVHTGVELAWSEHISKILKVYNGQYAEPSMRSTCAFCPYNVSKNHVMWNFDVGYTDQTAIQSCTLLGAYILLDCKRPIFHSAGADIVYSHFSISHALCKPRSLDKSCSYGQDTVTWWYGTVR